LVPAAVGRALETNPADLDASQFLLLYHQYQGDYATAKLVGQDGLKRNPLFFPNRMVLGEIFRQEGNYPEAIREQERVLEQDPTNVYSITYLARTFIDSGDLGGARNALDRVRPADRQNHRVGRARAMLLARQGRRANALEEMNEGLLKWERLIAYETAEAAEFFALVGDTEQAIEWLDLAVRNGDERAEWFRRDPLLAGIRSHPRFEQILQSIEYRRQQRK
jgi:tetratricopeptide (TPR) repeat protein